VRQGRQIGQQRGALPAIVLCAAACLVYSSLGLAAHRSLHTNAFDLSVFDYALWSTATGGPVAYVPMFRHSLFAQHFMPTLLAWSPLASLFDGPAWLIVLQAAFHAAAAFLLYRFALRHTSNGVALALTAAFLFSRRAHGAVTSVFYIESAEPLLVFGALLAWESRRLALYWVLVVLALGCKEDVALYFASFGVVIAFVERDRRTGLVTTSLAVVWLALAVGFAIPSWRELYSLDRTNPFLEGRYAGIASAVTHALSFESLARIVTVLSATGLTALLAPAWAAIVLPGVLVNLAAAEGTLQTALLGHYLWPILPWLFVAAAIGIGRIGRGATLSASPVMRWLPVAIVLVALIDLPLPRAITRTSWQPPADAQEVLRQLRLVPHDASVLAQPNLIPHLPRRREMHSLGVYTAGQPEAEYVLLTTVGDLWPFDAAEVAGRAASYARDPRFEQLADGPLIAFRRR
jgi:uncharacterized membrane protein